MICISKMIQHNNIHELLVQYKKRETFDIVIEDLINITELYVSMKELEQKCYEKGELFKVDTRIESFFKNDSQKIWNYVVDCGYV
jgi:hypothetical protein